MPSLTRSFGVGTLFIVPAWPYLNQWEREMIFVSSRKICKVTWQRAETLVGVGFGTSTPVSSLIYMSFLISPSMLIFLSSGYVFLMKRHLMFTFSENR